MSESDTHETDAGEYETARPYKNPWTLDQLYHGQGMSMAEIGEYFDVSASTIKYWLDQFDIETRPPMDERDREATVSRAVRRDGYVQYSVPDGEGEREKVYAHQLAALVEYSAEDVFDSNTHVHHRLKTLVNVDVAANLEVLTAHEHIHLHAGGAGHDDPEDVFADMALGTDGGERGTDDE